MHPAHLCALVLLACGTAALLLSALALAVLPTPYARLHALAPATSLGVPLVCLALAVDAGPGRAAVKLLFVGALAAVSGPVTTIVIGRTMAREGEVPGDVADRQARSTRERGQHRQGGRGAAPGSPDSGPDSGTGRGRDDSTDDATGRGQRDGTDDGSGREPGGSGEPPT